MAKSVRKSDERRPGGREATVRRPRRRSRWTSGSCTSVPLSRRRSVNEMILEAAPVTFALVMGGAILWMLIALPVGILSALRPRSLLDNTPLAGLLASRGRWLPVLLAVAPARLAQLIEAEIPG